MEGNYKKVIGVGNDGCLSNRLIHRGLGITLYTIFKSLWIRAQNPKEHGLQ